jgi:acyl carrier protein
MKNVDQIKVEVRNYLKEASLSSSESIEDDTLIFDAGILDSMGLLFLIEFLNENFEISVEDEELLPDNFETVNSIAEFVQEKL